MEKEFYFHHLSEKQRTIQARVVEALTMANSPVVGEMMKKIKDVEEETRLKIAFVGQHNAGKSTIVSALTKDESIKISTNVETDTTTEYKWGEVLLFDTPGLAAGVKTSHDESAYMAIERSDILIFCITASLFDDLLMADFVNLAYKRAYKHKIVLAVNKMSLEEGEYEVLKHNYYTTLKTTLEEQGGNLDDFPVVFFDAKDYKEGIEDNDPELIGFSHFDDFVENLNELILVKGLFAKINTKCTILLDSIADEIANTDTELNKNMMIILNRLERLIRNSKRDTYFMIRGYEKQLRSDLLNIGNQITMKIGVEKIAEADIEVVNDEIEKKTELAIEEIETKLSEINEGLENEISEILTSDIGQYVFNEINSNEFSVNSISVNGFNEFIERYGPIEEMLKRGGSAVAKMAFKEGANTSKLISSSGTTIHTAVLKIGHFFGKSFKPWEAVKIANKIGNVAKVLGPILAGIDVLLALVGKGLDEKQLKEIQHAKEQSMNTISSIVSDIVEEIERQYKKLEKDLFDQKTKDISEIKNNMIMESKNNSEHVELLKKCRNDLELLINCFEKI